MNPTNIAAIIAGPAIVQFKGATFYSKGDIQLTPTIETFQVEADPYRIVDEREANNTTKVVFTPAGAWAALAVLWPYATLPLGSFITPARTFESVNTGTNQITITAHNWRNGGPVSLGNIGGALPGTLTAGTIYYVHVVDANTITLHTTAAAAIAGTNAIVIGTAGTGTTRMVEQEPLTIWSLDGKQYTFNVAAVTKMPQIYGSAVKTLLGEVEFECFRSSATAQSAANSLYTIAASPFTDTSFDPTLLLTQPYDLQWGLTAPWASMPTKDGITWDFPLQLEPVTDDASGVLTRKLAGLQVTVSASPTNVDEVSLLNALQLQGAGSGRGRRLTGANLDMVGTGVWVRCYAAGLKAGPMAFSSRNDRIGQLQWIASRSFLAGAPLPLFYVGTVAPAE